MSMKWRCSGDVVGCYALMEDGGMKWRLVIAFKYPALVGDEGGVRRGYDNVVASRPRSPAFAVEDNVRANLDHSCHRG